MLARCVSGVTAVGFFLRGHTKKICLKLVGIDKDGFQHGLDSDRKHPSIAHHRAVRESIDPTTFFHRQGKDDWVVVYLCLLLSLRNE